MMFTKDYKPTKWVATAFRENLQLVSHDFQLFIGGGELADLSTAERDSKQVNFTLQSGTLLYYQ